MTPTPEKTADRWRAIGLCLLGCALGMSIAGSIVFNDRLLSLQAPFIALVMLNRIFGHRPRAAKEDKP